MSCQGKPLLKASRLVWYVLMSEDDTVDGTETYLGPGVVLLDVTNGTVRLYLYDASPLAKAIVSMVAAGARVRRGSQARQ